MHVHLSMHNSNLFCFRDNLAFHWLNEAFSDRQLDPPVTLFVCFPLQAKHKHLCTDSRLFMQISQIVHEINCSDRIQDQVSKV